MDPLVTEKALTLGSSIAKSIISQWLREKTEQGTKDNIIATFKKYIPETLAQKRAQLQLDRISVSITEQMQSIFKFEGAHLEDNSIIAVADAVARTLDKTYIVPQTLAEQNLDPTKLVALCRSADPKATMAFSAIEREFYNSVLSYAAQFICDTASRLPSFTEKTLGEILAREDLVLSKVNEIAANFQRIHEALSTSTGSAIKDKFEADFRLATIRRLSELSLFGLDISETSRHYSLTVAYVSLTVQHRPQTPDQQSSGDPAGKSTVLTPDDLEQSISIEDGLETASGKTLIIGHAGSGKTTLLQWIAVQSASRSLTGRLSKYNDCVPFFIRLRDFAASSLPPPESFASLTAPEIGGRMPANWAHEKLSSGKAILLIDGIDEIPRNQRTTLREWVLSLHAQYPGTALFITSRPYASNDEWYERSGFGKVELQPMDISRIGEFIEHWHNAIEAQLNSESQRTALAPLAEGLKSLLSSQPRLAELASTPLLCAMICALHRDRNHRLPSDRVGLYRACIEALVDRRDPERRISLADYPELSFRHKLLLLQDFAYYLLRNSLTEAAQEQLEARVTSKISSLGISPTPTSRDVCRLLVERSGVLREVIAGRVDFIHKTFQEFLAAQAVLDEGDIGLLIKNAPDDEWREVIILAAGLAPSRITDQLISSLIQEGDSQKARRHQLHLLAVGCLGAAAATSEELRADVGKRIKALVPPTNLRDAKEIAAAGDLAVPFLKHARKIKSQHAAACVRALSLIGTDAACDAIKTYAHDDRQAVQQEILKAWSSFDPDTYAKLILKEKSFVVVRSGIPLSTLRHLSRLNQLVIDSVSGTSATPLTHLKQLEFLSINGGRTATAVDLTDIPRIGTLKNLQLWRLDILGLPSFAPLKQLRDVGFSNLPNLQQLDSLLDAPALERIYLSELPAVDNMPSLRTHKTLRDVTLRSIGKTQQIHQDCFPASLESLDIDMPGGMESLGFLEPLTSLHHLGLSCGPHGAFPIHEFRNHITRLSPQLASLRLSGLNTHMDFALLSGCTNLQSLHVKAIDGISNAAALNARQTTLRLHLQSIASSVDLSELRNIGRPFQLHITFSGDPIVLAPLRDCKSLTSLHLDGVRVVDRETISEIGRNIYIDARNIWS